MAIQVLDCTLRDGGYYTDWDFAPDMVERYVDGVARLPVDIVEIGYSSHPAPGYFGRFFHLTAHDLAPIKARLRPAQKLGIMLDAKATQPARVGALLKGLEGCVDLVRLAVAPSQIAEALELAAVIREHGFEVGFNLMYLSAYADDVGALQALVPRRRLLASIALVDSYGACTPAQVGRAIAAVCTLLPGMPIGFHGHDNLGLAYANTLAAVDAGAAIVDATFAGMGRGAGNTRTELFLVHQAAREGTALDYDALAQVMGDMEALRQTHRWGTNLAYMISGAGSLPQREVMDWLGKNRYSVVSILRALHREAGGAVDDAPHPALDAAALGWSPIEDVLIIGGGATVRAHHEALSRLVQAPSFAVVHANLRNLGDTQALGARQIVCLAGHTAPRLPSAASLSGVAAFAVPTPPRLEGSLPPGLEHPVLAARPFTGRNAPALLGPVSDIGPLSLALGCALMLQARRVWLAGFDGYVNATVAQQALADEIHSMLAAFQAAHPRVQLRSLTPTLYDVPVESVYARLAAG